MTITFKQTPNRWVGGNRCEVILIHWWNRPEKKPTLEGTVNYLLNPANKLSAHYVVSGKQIIQLCKETDRAWHAKQANDFAIGIEVDPNTPPGTYETVGELVRDIRSRHGDIPLKRHSDYVNTECPGTVDLDKIEQYAQGGNEVYQGKTAEQWAKEVDTLRKIAEARAALLARVGQAAGVNPDNPIESDDVEQMVVNIDAKNRKIDELREKSEALDAIDAKGQLLLRALVVTMDSGKEIRR
jgi:hypothetical protein